MSTFKRYYESEYGQGAIEYILPALAGGIIVASVVIFTIYSKMTGTAANRLNETTDAASSTMSSRISAEIGNMFGGNPSPLRDKG